MPCDCEEIEPVPLRFVGGKDKPRRLRGRFLTYETGKIYRMPPGKANAPFWVPATDEEFDAQEEALAKVGEESVDSTESEQDDIAISSELSEGKLEDVEPPVEPSDGLHTEFGTGITEEELIRGMDVALLKNYIVSNGGKVDGRWGRKRLVQEALKL